MAPGWERWREQLADALTPVRELLIRELAPKPGMTVLELGAGTGETGFEAAPLLGDDGRLVSTDFSPEMVEVARRRGAELGLGNVDYRVVDAERIELDSGSVDGVLCQSTYMLTARLRRLPRSVVCCGRAVGWRSRCGSHPSATPGPRSAA